MKTRIFLCLCLTLALKPLFAQQQPLPRGVQIHARDWTQKLLQVLHHAGNPAGAPGQAVANRGVLQLDSTKVFNGYFPGPDSTPVSRTVYQYPQAQVRLEIVDTYESGAWVPESRNTLTSDSQDRLVEILAEAWDPESQEFVPDSRVEVFPHGDDPNQVDSLVTSLWDADNQSWSRIFAIWNTFDDQDRLLESKSLFDYFGTTLLQQDLYSYDPNGDNYLIENYQVINGVYYPSGMTTLVYQNHQPKEVTTFLFDGQTYLPQNRDTYAYYPSGAVLEHYSLVYDEVEADWTLAQALQYEYDNADRLTVLKSLTVNFDESIIQQKQAYAYVDGENLALVTVQYWDDNETAWILDNKEYYYYNSLAPVFQVPLAAGRLTVFPNPAIDQIQLEVEKQAAIRLFDAQGRQIRAVRVEPGLQTLDLDTLPSGHYTVTAQEADRIWVAKIVKQ
ncbi:MAG: T9SS type A sorting domain-containing protein [Bacteroidetes bacterium]|nr:MAG: T9SS type A sorting domain-containing protein [Bacteroidota bacterium]